MTVGCSFRAWRRRGDAQLSGERAEKLPCNVSVISRINLRIIENCPLGLKPQVSSNDSRGAEAPLFHGGEPTFTTFSRWAPVITLHEVAPRFASTFAAASDPERTQSGTPIPPYAFPARARPRISDSSTRMHSTRATCPTEYWAIACFHL
jgi:hypothetical protein